MDSSCFIDVAKARVKRGAPDRRDDVWFVRALMEAALHDELEVYVSALTVAECTHADGDISDATQKLFGSLLTSGQYTKQVQPDPFIAIDARDLRWKHGITLAGADGLHVASALFMKCDEFLTTDEKGPLRHEAKLKALGMRVAFPKNTNLLPSKYRQGKLFDEPKVARKAAVAAPAKRARARRKAPR